MISLKRTKGEVMARILVIDDEELVRSALRLMLEFHGHEVTGACNGEEGIALHEKEPFDLIITDILMPRKEGVETIMELKRDYEDLKIIAISGGGKTRVIDYLKTARLLGADVTLAKPFDNAELLAAVETCLSGKRCSSLVH